MADTPFVDAGENVRVGNLLVQGRILTSGDVVGHESFFYVATGLEGASFVVTLPTARASANYLARASGAGLAAFLVFDCPRANYLADRFTLNCSAAPTAGDVIAISVEAL